MASFNEINLQVGAKYSGPQIGWFSTPTIAGFITQTGETTGPGTMPSRPSTLDQCLLCGGQAVRLISSLANRETLPMRKTSTGEPCAGKPHARVGGRGSLRLSLPLSVFRRLVYKDESRRLGTSVNRSPAIAKTHRVHYAGFLISELFHKRFAPLLASPTRQKANPGFDTNRRDRDGGQWRL